jgi:SAM-dependent methyltransferase
MGATESLSEDKFANQEWGICEDCGCIQLIYLLPLEILYRYPHNDGVVSETWERHDATLVEEILKLNSNRICEIGGGSGNLANKVVSKRKTISYTIVDPNANPNLNGVKIVRGLIERNLDETKNCDLIIMSHVFEHLYEPNNFLVDLKNQLREESKVLISVPQIDSYLRDGAANGLNFEHTYYLDENIMKYLAAISGMKVESSKYFRDHSVFYILSKGSQPTPFRPFNGMDLTQSLFSNIFSSTRNFVESINEQSLKCDEMYVFGAHVFTQHLIHHGLKTENVRGVLDNSPTKQGKRLYGTQFLISSPEILRGRKNVCVVIPPSKYLNEMLQQVLQINEEVKIFIKS